MTELEKYKRAFEFAVEMVIYKSKGCPDIDSEYECGRAYGKCFPLVNTKCCKCWQEHFLEKAEADLKIPIDK